MHFIEKAFRFQGENGKNGNNTSTLIHLYFSVLVCSERYKKCYNIIPELTNWRHAGHDCWRRNMKLVAINSVNELRFVKQLLRRETQFTRDRPSAVIDSLQSSTSFFAHIGNSSFYMFLISM